MSDLDTRTDDEWCELREEGVYMIDLRNFAPASGGTYSYVVIKGRHIKESDECATPTKIIKSFDTLKEAENFILKQKEGEFTEFMIYKWKRSIFIE